MENAALANYKQSTHNLTADDQPKYKQNIQKYLEQTSNQQIRELCPSEEKEICWHWSDLALSQPQYRRSEIKRVTEIKNDELRAIITQLSLIIGTVDRKRPQKQEIKLGLLPIENNFHNKFSFTFTLFPKKCCHLVKQTDQ